MQRKTNYFAAGLIVASFLLSLSLGVDSASAASATITTNTDITLNASSAGNGVTIDEESIGITTTCNKGYNLTIATSTSTDLYLNGDSTKTAAYTAVDGTSALDSTNNTNKWGYTLTNGATASTIFSPLSTTASSIRTISQTTDITSETIPIYYGIKTDSTIDPGTYAMGNNGTITYYLTMNPLCNVVDIAYDGNNADAGTMGAEGTGVIHTGVKDGDTVDLIASNFSRDGYGFAGWSLDQDAGTKLLDNDNTNNPIVYGPQESITLPEGFTANDTDNDGIVKLYAVWLQSQGNLQGWMGCNNLDTTTYDQTTGALDLTKNSVTALTDQRDNDTYAVARLADGKCWMIENLRLDNTAEHNSDGTLAQGYGTSVTYGNFSGLADAESANFTDSTTANSLYYSGTQEGTASIDIGTSNYPDYRMPRYNNLNTPANSNDRPQNPTSNTFADNNTTVGMYSYGNYYTWHAAMANTIYYSSPTAQDTYGKTSETVDTSLCPTGWRLPYGRGTGNGTMTGGFYNLNYKINNDSNVTDSTASLKLRSFPNNFLYSGYFSASSAYNRGGNGYYWSSTAGDQYNSYFLRLGSSIVRPGTYSFYKHAGLSIRCTASDPQTYTLSYDANGGTGAPEAQTTIANGFATFTLSTTTPTRSEYLFYGWNTESDGSGTFYIEGQEITVPASAGTSITLHAIWTKDALLDTGQNVNRKLKRLAGNSSATYSTQDTSITALERSSTLPNGFTPSTENTISDSTSPLPIYAWYDSTNTTIYYYSDATNILMNSDSSSLFYQMRALSNLASISTWDTTKTVNMASMFYYTGYGTTSFDLDLSSWNTSHVVKMSSMFSNAGYNATTWSVNGLSSWDTSKVTTMSSMFDSAGYSTTSFIMDLSSWNTSSVTDMSRMFVAAGRNTTDTFSLNLSSWDTSKVKHMGYMFLYAGYGATASFSLDLSSWDTSSLTSIAMMFEFAGYNATTWSVSGLSSWDTSKVTSLYRVFQSAGYHATAFVLDLSSWNTSSVTDMNQTFASSGHNATTWSVGDISSWDTSNVGDMTELFDEAGYNATTWFAGDLSSWNTSNVTNMDRTYNRAAYKATTWTIGDLSSWDTSSVTNMYSMFAGAGYNTTAFSLDLSSWDTSSVTDMSYMFAGAGYKATTWTIGNLSSWDTSSVTNMSSMFASAGYNTTAFSLNLSSWNTSIVTNMSSMFAYSGYSATTWSIDGLSSWNTSSVTSVDSMFSRAGYSATSFIMDLSSWNTSGVTSASGMFAAAGYKSSTFTLNLSSWNTSGFTDIRNLFYDTGYNATSFTLNLSSWDTSNVTNMFNTFNDAGYKAMGSAWSVTIPQTNNGTSTGPIANTTSTLYGNSTSVTASPPRGTPAKHFTLAN